MASGFTGNAPGDGRRIGSVLFLDDLSMLAGTSKKTLRVWDTERGDVQSHIPVPWKAPIDLVFTPTDELLYWVTGHPHREVEASQWVQDLVAWDIRREVKSASIEVPVDEIGVAYCIALSPDGKTLVTGHGVRVKTTEATRKRGMVVLWDPVTLEQRLRLPHTKYPGSGLVIFT